MSVPASLLQSSQPLLSLCPPKFPFLLFQPTSSPHPTTCLSSFPSPLPSTLPSLHPSNPIMAGLAHFQIPKIANEPMAHYAPGSAERKGLEQALAEMQSQAPFHVPCIIDGKEVKSGNVLSQAMPHDHAKNLCTYEAATPEMIASAIESSLAAQKAWEELPWNDRAAIFLKAADLCAGKYRYPLMAATMLGQGKNAWQAEIDAAAEMADFFRFSVKFVDQLYAQQPSENSPGCWNRTEFRPLEGFVLAVTPFNFTAIGGNLVAAPAIVGNVTLWKPSPMATYANYLTHKLLLEAGVPGPVIQFVPGDAPAIVKQCTDSPKFAGLHFTGSTAVFKNLWKQISNNIDIYRSYPRIVGETGGKNFHLIHNSADIKDTVIQSIRSGFEYSGQKCSALGRVYVPRSQWPAWGEEMKKQVESIKIGPCEEFSNFLGPVINEASFDKITGLIKKAQEEGGEILAGGKSDKSKGYFVDPTVIVTKDPKSVTMVNEIFGPVLTVFVYEDDEFEQTCELIDNTTTYALTGSIFASDRAAVVLAQKKLRNSAGNFYINDKCTGAVVGQQPFGGARGSGTNDKSGSVSIFYRFISARSVKETFVQPSAFAYPSNAV